MAALAQSTAATAAVSSAAPVASSSVRSSSSTPAASFAFTGLKRASTSIQVAAPTDWSSKTVSNSSRVECMKVWNPYNNKKFETLSYLPPLSDVQIAKQIQYLLNKGWIPTVEFDEVGDISRTNGDWPTYYDGRYWTMWKLPMFGCTDPAQVLTEIQQCKTEYPKAFIRVIGFDNMRQVQCAGFIVHKP
ncbi:hypothetical protein CBR_g37370 [Chara braunii]|uniref:Ribulose bisphosphate carboxylase small subunit, chloroplastic n=1 Tax=Chara braunii TaxID=69332 RepID=A0A388JZQ4_CHABU|nr:hypothetical protein CBR_g37370 [Chara braunii]|eukprot:GBG63284.1 hypothetical protein CBR_g37370 [Chara braunii]